ncbi:recombinase family protein [Kribbella sp. WER1]
MSLSSEATQPLSSQRPWATLYVRLSKASGDTNLSGPGYMQELRDFADREGYRVYAEHFDDGISGAVRDRPEFLSWLDDVRQGPCSVLLTPHADRITREGVNAAAMVLDVVEGKDPTTGKVVATPARLRDLHGTDSEGDQTAFRFSFVIAAEVGRAELQRIRDRNARTRKRLRQADRWPGGRVPYCAEVIPAPNGKGKVLGPNEEHAERAREAARRIIRGDAVTSVCRYMNVQGWRTTMGKPWAPKNLTYMLLSPFTRRFALTAAEARALESALEPEPDPAKRPGKPQRWLLAKRRGVCAGCRRALATSVSVVKGHSYPRYRCALMSSGGCDAPVSISATALDAWLEQEFLRRYGAHEHVQPMVIVTGAEDVEAAEQEHEASQKALLAAPSTEALSRYQSAQERLEAARAMPVSRETVLVPSGMTVAQFWAAADTPTRADLLADAMSAPVEVVKSERSPGRSPIDFDARIRVFWRGDPEWGEDYLAGQTD